MSIALHVDGVQIHLDEVAHTDVPEARGNQLLANVHVDLTFHADYLTGRLVHSSPLALNL